MFAHKPHTLGKSYLFLLWFRIFNPPEEGGQSFKDLITPPCLATDGHRDVGWIRQRWSLQWSLNQKRGNGHPPDLEKQTSNTLP